jgi:hypothetical protein
MRTFPGSLFLLFAILANFSGIAQDFLSIKDENGLGRIRIYPGSTFMMKLKGEKEWQETTLNVLLPPDTIILDGRKTALNEIMAIRADRAFPTHAGSMLAVAGIGYAGIYAANGLLSDSRPLLTNSAIIASSSLFLGGNLIRMAGKRVFRLGRKYHLSIVHFNFNP